MAEWDDDIAAMDLSDIEKNGLQIYRNYSKAFDAHRERQFSKAINTERFETKKLSTLLKRLVREEVRLLPVIACAYADDILLAMFKAAISKNALGGASGLYDGYGPLSSLANRTRLASAFDLVGLDLLHDLDRIRKVRNVIAHEWDVGKIFDFVQREPLKSLSQMDGVLGERPGLLPPHCEKYPLEIKFRIRLVWILSRLTYEAAFYHRARKAQLEPSSALYGVNQPKALSEIAGLAVEATTECLFFHRPVKSLER
jgi:hypothetical protein